jgi:hypothetical protein
MPSSNQSRRGGGAGGISYGTLGDAFNYLINKAMGKPIPPEQQEAWDSLNNVEKKVVQETVQEGVEVGVVPEPKPVRPLPPLPTRRPERANAPPLPTRRPERANAPPLPGGNSPSTSTAGNNSTSGRNPPSTSTSLGRRIAEILMEDISDDAKETKRMEMEREMNVAGRKKGGMVKKKKAPVKKAYGGMVKKKQGGSARKVNMKAGFTRRGCSKG